MTYKEFADYIRKRTKTNSTTFTDADILLSANIHKNTLAMRIMKVQEDYFIVPNRANLVAGIREYAFPVDTSSLVRVEIQLTPTSTPVIAEEIIFNSSTIPVVEADIQAQSSDSPPGYDITRDGIYLYTASPIVDVVLGLTVTVMMLPDDFTDLSSIIDMSVAPSPTGLGFPEKLHDVLARKVIKEFKEDNEIKLNDEERYDVIERDTDIAVGIITQRNMDLKINPTQIYNDGSQY